MKTEISEKVWSTDQWNPSKTFAPPFWHDWKGSYSDRSERNGTFHVVLVSRITFKVFMILNPLLQKQNLINQNYVLLTWADEIFLYKLSPKKRKKKLKKLQEKKVKFIQVFMYWIESSFPKTKLFQTELCTILLTRVDEIFLYVHILTKKQVTMYLKKTLKTPKN